ncbi:MAG TPA: imidazolonepropionase [Gemmatimonadales bacterium]
MPVLRSIRTLATCRSEGRQSDIHPIHDAALVWEGGTLLWVGPEKALPADYATWESRDADGALVIPGLIDCHTHLAFGGWRAEEFEQRIQGSSYLDIARKGGGIMSTVAQTRTLSEDALLERARGFLDKMMALGVTTVECKSGYGLNIETELRLLRVYQRLGLDRAARIIPTFLGAHVVPPEFRDRREDYIRLLIEGLIPLVTGQGLARFCDAFVEDTAFTVPEARRILSAGKAAGLGAKLHADQLSSCGGAELAAELGAVSADHLECVSPAGIAAMAQSGTVAVSLPLASLYLNHTPLPARRLIEAGVPVAVATDFNPGSAPSFHLPLALSLACTMQRMTPAEALKGATIIAARALAIDGVTGSLEAGKSADFAVIDAESVNEWCYHFTPNACRRVVARGREVKAGSR